MLATIMEKVLENAGVKDKLGIAGTHHVIGASTSFRDPLSGSLSEIKIGDDCAAIPDGQGGFLLFSAEGIIPSFLAQAPWFAGYSAVMVNISDVCAMGGLPLAVTDVLWMQDVAAGAEMWAGMTAAAEAYGVPIVGGHTCYRTEEKHLAVAIVGKAARLLSSYDATEGDVVLMVVDLAGKYFREYPFWDASTNAPPERLQQIMRLPYEVANRQLSRTAKDISMGGTIGTLAMLLNTSGKGAKIMLEKIPRPENVSWEKWLVSFPSYGYLLTASAADAAAIKLLFSKSDLACEQIGEIIASREIIVSTAAETFSIPLNERNNA